jgi:hypothetical protein
MLIGTLLIFSSRRVAVTTISSRAPVAAGSEEATPPAPAAVAANAVTPTKLHNSRVGARQKGFASEDFR